MLKKVFRGYFAVPLVWRVAAGFLLGIAAGILCSELAKRYGSEVTGCVTDVVAPFGTILIAMLKMVVIPIIFFSLVSGAASLPVRKFGKLGISVLLWYFLTSLFAGMFGIFLAAVMNPAMENARNLSEKFMPQVASLKMYGASGGLSRFLSGLFMNPFQALAEGQFLPVIVFSILFGLAARIVLDRHGEDGTGKSVELMLRLVDAAQKASFQIIDWIMEYFPVGVFALTTSNFALYGTELFGPYMRIALCVICGVLLMILVIYPLLLLLLCRENPYRIMNRIKEAVITAFLTRSSAATLPVSFRIAKEKLHVKEQLSSFALPLGATINMDGVCIHLPVFAILAANVFGITLGPAQLALLLISVVFASVGAGGIPGGSVFLLFMVLENLGLNDAQVAAIVALAIGINPLLDMFETACNVTGDNVCNYIVGKRGGMLETPPQENGAHE